MTATADAPCALHKAHSPRQAYNEQHHVIPQAWQALYAPAGQATTRLWDARTIPACPTGHRNLHFFLVIIVKAMYVAVKNGTPDTYEQALSVSKQRGVLPKGHQTEVDWSMTGLQRWYEAGGTVQLLGDHDEWGQS